MAYKPSVLSPQDGGTGVANTGTITLGGNLATSGAFSSTFTMTNTTTVTFPTSGTLATTTQLPTLPLTVPNGGTGVATLTNHGVLIGAATSNITQLAAAATNTVFQGNTGADPSFNLNLTLNDTNAGLTQGVISWTSGPRIHNFGTDNIFMGTTAGNGTLTGTDNIGIGLNSLNALTSGTGNVFVGANCGKFLQSGSSNVGMGVATLRQSVTNSFNTAIGHNAGILLTGGSNTLFGYQSGNAITSGTQNVLIGYQAGSAYISSESSNIILGYGVAGTAAESNVTRIGTGQTACYISGIDAVSVATNAVLVQEASNQLGTTTTTYPRTNAVNTILYASSANVMSALATANSGVLATNSSGVPSIDTTNFAVLSTGLQLKGNNTNTAPPAGFIGEQIRATRATGSELSLSSGVAGNVASISLTAGIWDVSGGGVYNMSSTFAGTYGISIGTTSATVGTLGDNYFLASQVATVNSVWAMGFVPSYRITLSSTTTVYLVAITVIATGTINVIGRISATRVG